MNDIKNLNILIEKYWSGETTLAEEQRLKEHFRKHPEAAGPEQAFFAFTAAERARTYTREIKMPQRKQNVFVKKFLPIAASFILLASAFWAFSDHTSHKKEVVIDDPQMALQITREAFALLNGKVDKGEQAVRESIIHLDKTIIYRNL